MKINKSILLAIPTFALAIGAFSLSMINKSESLRVEAASYTRSNRSITLNEGAISATFNVSENTLDMKGWLLCLLHEKPSYGNDRKLTDSSNIHPYLIENCKHYFFSEGTTKEGTMNITWAADANDQKTAWSADGQTATVGYTLEDVFDDEDWYIVIGPRHLGNDSWGDNGIGAGHDLYWENCDYYAGRKSNLLGDIPSGQIYLDLTENQNWGASNAQYGVYFWNDDTGENGFSDFATSESTNIYIAQYELDFTPTNMLAVAFNNDAPNPSWDYDITQTKDFAFYEFGVIGITGDNSWNGALSEIRGLDYDVVLDHYKRNGSNQSEHYSNGVDLEIGDEFDIKFNGEYYHGFTTHSSLSDSFEAVGDKIHVNKAGHYSLYFNTTEGLRSVYITTHALAAADEFADLFLKRTNGYCSEAISESIQSELRTAYVEIASIGGAQAAFYKAEVKRGKNLEYDSYASNALSRYVDMQENHGYEDFLYLSGNNPIRPSNHFEYLFKNNNQSVTSLIIVFVATTSIVLLAIAGYSIARKKTH